jgi:hypothetical protein
LAPVALRGPGVPGPIQSSAGDVPRHGIDGLLSALSHSGKEQDEPPKKRTPGWYQQLAKLAEDARKPLEKYWRQIEEEYRPKKYEQSNAPKDDYDNIQPGRVYQMVHRTEAQHLGAPPKFKCRGYTAYWDKTRAEALERGLNNEWDQNLALMSEMALGDRSCSKFGLGIWMTTYDATFSNEADEEEAEERRELAMQDPVLAAAAEDVAMEVAKSEQLGPAPVRNTTFEEDDLVLEDTINTRQIPVWDFLIDPEATKPEDAKWLGRKMVCDLEAVKANPRFKHTRTLQATDMRSQACEGSAMTAGDSPSTFQPYEYVTLYEIWERKIGGGWRRITFAKNHPYFLEVVDEPLWIGHPFTIVRWNEDDQLFYAQSDMLSTESERRAERKMLTKMVEGYSNDQDDITFIDESIFNNEEQIYDATTGEPNRFVKIKSPPPNAPMSAAFHTIPKQSKSADAIPFLYSIQNSLQQTAGLGANQQAQALKSDTSAREVQEISSTSRMAHSHKDRGWYKAVLEVARKRLGLMAQFYDKSRILRLAGEDAAEAWPENWTKGDVQTGLGVFIDYGSMRPRDDTSDFAALLQILNIAGSMPIFMGNTNLVRLQKLLFKMALGTTGESLLMSTDEESINNANMMAQGMTMMGSGGAKGSAPKLGGQEAAA